MKITDETIFNICKTYAHAMHACSETNLNSYAEQYKDAIFDTLRGLYNEQLFTSAQVAARLAELDPNGCMNPIANDVEALKDAKDAFIDSCWHNAELYYELLPDGRRMYAYAIEEFIPFMHNIVCWLDKQGGSGDAELYELIEDVFLDAVLEGDVVVFGALQDIINKAEAIMDDEQYE